MSRTALSLRMLPSLDAAQVDGVRALHDAAAATDGHESLGDAVWRDLHDPASAGQHAEIVATDARTRLVGFAHVATPDGSRHAEVGLVVQPEARGEDVERPLLDAALDAARAQHASAVIWWRIGADAKSDALATAAGFRPSRDLHRMEVPLPLPRSVQARWPEGVEVRTFVPGQDEDPWLAVNNAAFAGHPEQGDWTRATLERRMREPWFDPSGFVVAVDDDGVAGFCWTKVHDDGAGEIYVIGVDPSRQGRGLGRPLVVAGLQSLADRGVTTGMLFVDAANDAAFRLYRSLGFETVRVDRAYEHDLQGGDP